ncbi:MAG: LON peptidase substrate-binding domain-containing protein [Candidatus Eisenbacteria bacterium]
MGFTVRVDDRDRCPSGKLPLLPLRDVVVFPHMTLPLFVGRPGSVSAIERSKETDRLLFATAQRRPEVSDPTADDLHTTGTLVRVLQVFRLPDGTMRILVEGQCRARLVAYHATAPGRRRGRADPRSDRGCQETARALQTLQATFAQFAGPSRRVPEEIYSSALSRAIRWPRRISSRPRSCRRSTPARKCWKRRPPNRA